MFGNGNGKEWEKPYGNPMGMGIGYKIGNGNGKEWQKPYGNPTGMGIDYKIGNGKEWESLAREWEGVGM